MNKPQSKYFLRKIKLEFFFLLTCTISLSDWYFHLFRSVSHHRHHHQHHHHHHYHRIIIIVINTVGYCPINITNSYLQASLSVLACSQALKTTKKQTKTKNSVQTFFAEDKLGISFLFRSINITERCSRISSCIILSCLSSVSPSSLLLIIVY